jgi:hypothetical protein
VFAVLSDKNAAEHVSPQRSSDNTFLTSPFTLFPLSFSPHPDSILRDPLISSEELSTDTAHNKTGLEVAGSHISLTAFDNAHSRSFPQIFRMTHPMIPICGPYTDTYIYDGAVAVKEPRYVLTDRTYTAAVNSVRNRDHT